MTIDMSEKEFAPLCEEVWDLEFNIQDMPALTLAGLGLKAEIAARYTSAPDTEGHSLDDMAGRLIADVLRLMGQSPKWEA